SGRSLEKWINPNTFTMWTTITLPLVTLKRSFCSIRLRVSTPLISSPCNPACTRSTGPASPPRTIWTGISISVPVGNLAMPNCTTFSSPGAIRTPPISMVCLFCPSTMLFHKLNDMPGHIGSRGPFDSLEPRGGVHLEQQGSGAGLDQVHPGHPEAQYPGGAQGDEFFPLGELYGLGVRPPVYIGPEFVRAAHAFHAGHHPVAHHDHPKVLPHGLLDEPLQQDAGIHIVEGVDHGFGGFFALGQD